MSRSGDNPILPPDVIRSTTATYKILAPLGEGGSGQAFKAKVLSAPSGFPAEVVVKIPLLRKDSAFSDALRSLDIINKSLRTEIMLRGRIQKVACVAHILDSGILDLPQSPDVALPAFFAVQEFVEGDRLDHHVASYCPGGASFSGIPDAGPFFKLCLMVAGSLRMIHKEQIIHGDVWFRNVIISEASTAVFIDFGKSALKDLGLFHRDQNQEPFRPPEGRGSAKGDIHALGGLFYYLATGEKTPPKHIRDNDDLKLSIGRDIERLNPLLYDDNSGVVDVIARCRRYQEFERYHSVEGVIQDLETFCDSPQLDTGIDQPPPILLNIERSGQPLLARLARLRLRSEQRVLEDMSRGVYDLSGDHEDIVSGFAQYLSTLREGDQYLTLSTPAFWRRKNLGVNGRFLAMTKVAAQRKATIRRVFLTTEADKNNPETRQILEAHIAIAAELRGNKRHPVQTQNWELGAGGYFCGFVIVTEAERKEIVEQRNHFGLLITGNHETLAAPVYTYDEEIVGVEFRTSPAFTAGKRRIVESWLERSHPLEEFFSR